MQRERDREEMIGLDDKMIHPDFYHRQQYIDATLSAMRFVKIVICQKTVNLSIILFVKK